MTAPRILVVDDDRELREMLTRYLEAEGFAVFGVSEGQSALARFESMKPDLVVLDVAMPKVDGLEVLRRIRSQSTVHVIMLTAKAEEVDRVLGLTLGADDYVTKPFSPRELVARIRAVLRREREPVEEDEALRFTELIVDPVSREVTVDGRSAELTTLEFDLLLALASHPGRVFTRQRLLERVWGWDHYGRERVVDVHIANIRRALHDDAVSPRFIATVRGVGYKFIGVAADS
ncbi:MAG TPA: response regulator transcription factor [Acidimicrobiia bacterium]